MSLGPVYCPKDQTELMFVLDKDNRKHYYVCVTCNLKWDGHFPISDNVKLNQADW